MMSRRQSAGESVVRQACIFNRDSIATPCIATPCDWGAIEEGRSQRASPTVSLFNENAMFSCC